MGCNSPGSTHHLGCDCRELEWAVKLAAAESARREAEERLASVEEACRIATDLERAAREKAERERDEARASVARCHTLIDGLWAITDPEKHADIVASVDAEIVPCDRQFHENERLREALREIAEDACVRVNPDCRPRPCREMAACPREAWCPSCIARAALAGQEVGR